jgi:hypothetical protein
MRDSTSTKEKVEELKQDTVVQKALDQTAPPQEVTLPRKRQRKFFLTIHFLILFFLGVAYYLIH